MPDKKNPRKDEQPESVKAELIRDHLGKYLGLVEFGRKEFVITRNGKPSAKLVPLNSAA